MKDHPVTAPDPAAAHLTGSLTANTARVWLDSEADAYKAGVAAGRALIRADLIGGDT